MFTPKHFILDVDGVMTTGQFYYSAEGKIMKVFGPDDNDGLSLLRGLLDIRFVTGDKRGFPISHKRIADDMRYPLELVSTIRRIDWIREHCDPARAIYMGDGIFDHYVMCHVAYSIAPANAHPFARRHASHTTLADGGNGAVAEACLHILERFFTPYDPEQLPEVQGKLSGEWAV
jgi:3-deoxy-D-manno-octulosonate 8-phosphate phosphatase (KDO 8-P phosphatase)